MMMMSCKVEVEGTDNLPMMLFDGLTKWVSLALVEAVITSGCWYWNQWLWWVLNYSALKYSASCRYGRWSEWRRSCYCTCTKDTTWWMRKGKALALTLLTPIDLEIEMKNSRSELLMIAWHNGFRLGIVGVEIDNWLGRQFCCKHRHWMSR
jgi:hypothetical protein